MKTYFCLAVLLLAIVFTVLPSVQVSGSAGRKITATQPSTQQNITGKLGPAAVTFTVNSTNDISSSDVMPGDGLCQDGSGECTLRAAIEEANALPGNDTINFNIAPSGQKTITPTSALPVIAETLVINGTTQPGFPGTPIIELKGSVSGASVILDISASNCVIRGLVLNSLDGNAIRLTGDNNQVKGNFIGTDFSGTASGTGVGDSGISIAANGNIIGGIGAGDANVIAFNGRGVKVVSGVGNLILGNSIFGQVGAGIDLNSDGVTANDACDGDSGPNNLQNFPSLTAAQTNGSLVAIQGVLNSEPSKTYQVDFYANSACNLTGFGEGERFIGSTMVTTDPSCNAAISATFPVSVAVGEFITATATDPVSNTSEFSQCVTVVAGAISSDLQITKSDAPDPVLSGNDITYTITVTNNGPDTDAGVVFTDVVPTGTTFQSLTSPGSCSTPPVGGTGTITCSLGSMLAGQTISITLIVNVTAPPGSTITNTGSISGTSTDPTLSNNSATANTAVSGPGPCTLECPPDIVLTTPNNASCRRTVNYSPTPSGVCAEVTCTPPSGSLFNIGTTSVNCATSDEASCSFNVIIIDDKPPVVVCSADISTPAAPGQTSTAVSYPAPNVTDNCSVASAQCSPPSGSLFPTGTTSVVCTGTDLSSNSANCSFLVTVFDGDSPVIRCPSNVNVVPVSGQTSAVVNYPAPTITDNQPGATAVCSPASGSSFPTGTTTVTCTATDVVGNKAACSFLVSVGAPLPLVTIPGNKAAIEFGTVRPARKPPKPRKNPCTLFSIQNVGFAPLILTFDSIKRTGADVTSGRISDPNDVNGVAEITPTKFFTLFRVNSDQSLTQINSGEVLTTLQPGQSQSFCLKFAALIPALAGKTTGLAASSVLPDIVTSTLTFKQNAGADIAIPILGRVATGVVLIDPVNPRRPAVVSFTRSGNDITVSYAVFDSNLDVSRARYEFLDANGQVVAGPFDIDLTESVRSLNLVRGQSFSVEQRFTGASDSSEIIGVRVTVFDGETSTVGDSSTTSATQIKASSIQLMKAARGVTLYRSDLTIGPKLP